MVTRYPIGAVTALALALLGGFAAPTAAAQVAPPVVSISAADGEVERTLLCDGGVLVQVQPAEFTIFRSGDLTDEVVVDLSFGGTFGSIPDAPARIAIPAGEAAAMWVPQTSQQAGTIVVTISNTSFPGSFTVGEPSAATATIELLQVVADCGGIGDMTTTTSTTTPAPPAPAPPAAAPVVASASYTG